MAGTWLSRLLGTGQSTFGIGPKATRGTLASSQLTAARTHALPDTTGGLGMVNPANNGFRLSLGGLSTPVPITDITSSTVLYLSPHTSDRITLYDGTYWQERNAPVGLNYTPGAIFTSGKNYDVYAFLNSGALAVDFSPAWASDSARTHGTTIIDGVPTNSSAITGLMSGVSIGTLRGRYLGTVRTISTSAFADSAAQRFCWNMDNRVRRPLAIQDSTSSWNYTTASWRQARATTTNRVEAVVGWEGPTIQLVALSTVQATAALVCVGIGEDSTTDPATGSFPAAVVVSNADLVTGHLCKHPAVGYHAYNWLEYGGTGGVFYGTSGNLRGAGLLGWIDG